MSSTFEGAAEVALVARALVSKTANSAAAPPDPGSPEFLYAAVDAPGSTVFGLSSELTLDSTDADWDLPAGAIIVSVSVCVAVPFDAGTTNEIDFVVRPATSAPGHDEATFATCADVSVIAAPVHLQDYAVGVPVTFLPLFWADAFSATARFVESGSPATTGNAFVALTFMLVSE